MAANLNRIQLIGNVGADPEVRPLPSGTNVARWSLATNETYTDKNGQKQDRTEWHSIVAFGGLADLADKYIRKGSQLYIEGRLRSRQYETDAGETRKVTEVVALNVQLLGARTEPQVAEKESIDESVMASACLLADDVVDENVSNSYL